MAEPDVWKKPLLDSTFLKQHSSNSYSEIDVSEDDVTELGQAGKLTSKASAKRCVSMEEMCSTFFQELVRMKNILQTSKNKLEII